jgi:hypothetical protein
MTNKIEEEGGTIIPGFIPYYVRVRGLYQATTTPSGLKVRRAKKVWVE